MTIFELVSMAERIHDEEQWFLGTASTREDRNRFWARVIGCAHHGHPVFNPTPDRQWYLKRADLGRPQTDDVATSMPSRQYWDCITSAGADGYVFAAAEHHERLPMDQMVYAPPVPSGVDVDPSPPVVAPVTPYHEPFAIEFGLGCNAIALAAKVPIDPGMIAVHAQRAAYDYYVKGLSWPQSRDLHLADFRAEYVTP